MSANYCCRLSVLLKMSNSCLPRAKLRPAGVGRGDPNQDPYLPEPVGRIEFSLNPYKMLVVLHYLVNFGGSPQCSKSLLLSMLFDFLSYVHHGLALPDLQPVDTRDAESAAS